MQSYWLLKALVPTLGITCEDLVLGVWVTAANKSNDPALANLELGWFWIWVVSKWTTEKEQKHSDFTSCWVCEKHDMGRQAWWDGVAGVASLRLATYADHWLKGDMSRLKEELRSRTWILVMLLRSCHPRSLLGAIRCVLPQARPLPHDLCF
jgi:hypothetical protein